MAHISYPTLGVEEELFLVSDETADLCSEWPDELERVCKAHYPEQIVREFISSQVELITTPCKTVPQLHQQLTALRQFFLTSAKPHQLALLGSSTHPFADWRSQHPNGSVRYQRLAQELQAVAKRLLVSGMHIHIGVNGARQRCYLMNSLINYLPIISALSCSSPFWCGHDTGLNSYRLCLLNDLPRSGVPPYFATRQEYDNYLKMMIGAGAIESGRELWWDIRMSCRYPTVEVRIADTCASTMDAMAIAALLQCLARYLLRAKRQTTAELRLQHSFASENRWRAQRYGLKEGNYVDVNTQRLESFNTVITELVSLLDDDAKALGCAEYLAHCLLILQTGNAAEKQRALFSKLSAQGLGKEQALSKVAQSLLADTACESNPHQPYAKAVA